MQDQILTIGNISMPFGKFCDLLASRIATKIANKNQPEIISQAKAFKQYGRRNVEAWINSGRLQYTTSSTGRRFIRTADLEMLFTGTEGYIR